MSHPIRPVHVQGGTTLLEGPPGPPSTAFLWEGNYHVGGRDVSHSEAEWAASVGGDTPPVSFDHLGTISVWVCLCSFSRLPQVSL